MEEAESDFNTFDIVSDVSDHHFLFPDDRDSSFNNAKSSVYTHIMKEWKILEEHLPDSIYVRVYESRIDLMRAVIVGAAGTPYHDGLFFFDIKLPSEYPNNPPILYFHSFGLRLNPNLYSSGKVCLSLLNTWSGEKWDPQGSTLFQVLLSIQALVLNEKPYFNEPWQIHHINKTVRETWSREYSETAFRLTWQLGNHLVRRPPKNYEAFIRNHFRTRAATVLAACREYASGRVMVGHYCCNSLSPSLPCWEAKVSGSSRKMLREDLYPKLVQMFQSLGSFHVPEKLELEDNEQVNNGDENKGGGKIIVVASPKDKKKAGIFKKAVAKIKGVVMRWKNKNNSGNINKITT